MPRAVASFFNWLTALYYKVFGTKDLDALERMVIDALRDSLSVSGRTTLDAQISAASFIQRQAGGAKVCFYYPDDARIPLFEDTSPDLQFSTVVLETPDATERQSMRVRVFLHHGRLFSIEFPKRPDRYLQQHDMAGQPLRVSSVDRGVPTARS